MKSVPMSRGAKSPAGVAPPAAGPAGDCRGEGDTSSFVALAGREQDGNVALRLHGEVSPSSVPQLEELLDFLASQHPSEATVDLGDVTKVSPTILDAIGRRLEEVSQLELSFPGTMGRPARVATTTGRPTAHG